MAKAKNNKEHSFKDDDARVAYVKEETSSDGKFSSYVRVPTPGRLDADLIVQYRGEPKED